MLPCTMRILIGEYADGRLQPGFYEHADSVPELVLQELKGRFRAEYREANLRLTEQQLLAAATPDQDLIQAIHSFEGLDTVLNTLGKYTSEWYELHHPESGQHWEAIANEHIENDGLQGLNVGVGTLLASRDALRIYIEKQAREIVPNASAVVGELLAAKLLSAAGSLERIARLPSTTIQLLGAEQALFRHLRNPKSRPPKHGLLISHPLVMQATNKGKAARAVANAVALAFRIDFNHGAFMGEVLRKKAEVNSRAAHRT